MVAIMRRHLRHHPRDSDPFQDPPLLLSFKSLRRLLFSPSASSGLTSSLLLRPFLDTIRSEETGAAVTAAALSAVYNILTFDGPVDVGPALSEVVDAVTTCRFEVLLSTFFSFS